MFQTQPKYATYIVQHAHTGEIHSVHRTRRAAKAAKNAANDHALRVRGGSSVEKLPFWQRLLLGVGLR